MRTSTRYRLLAAFLTLGTIGLAGPLAAQAAAPPAPADAKGPRGGPAGLMFKQIDTNGDGVLDQAEIAAFKAKTATDVDTDQDGKVSLAEFQAWRDRATADNTQRMLDRLDTNKDGSVSVAEFTAAGDRLVTRLDRNKDGKIEQTELRQRGGPGKPGKRGAADPAADPTGDDALPQP